MSIAALTGFAARGFIGGASLLFAAVPSQAATPLLLADSRAALLGVIANPDVAFILLLVGIYALLLEFAYPGAIVPAILGIVCLALAALALSALPVQYGALALLLSGLALMMGEAFTPGFGIAGIAGLVAFVAGSHYLFASDAAGLEMRVSLPLIIGAAAASAALIFLVAGAALKARQRPPATGAEEMLAASGVVIDWDGGRGNIRIHGEVWAATADASLKPGDAVRVARRDGLTLIVEPQTPGAHHDR